MAIRRGLQVAGEAAASSAKIRGPLPLDRGPLILAELAAASPATCSPLLIAKPQDLHRFNRGQGDVRVYGSGLDSGHEGAILPASQVLPSSPRRLEALLEGRGRHRDARDRSAPLIWRERESHVALNFRGEVCLGEGDASMCNPMLRYDDQHIQVVAFGRGSHGGADNLLVYTLRSGSDRAQVQIKRFEMRGVEYGWPD